MSRGNRKKDNLLPLQLLLVQFTAAQNCGLLIHVVPGSQMTLRAPDMCTDLDSSLLDGSSILHPAGAYKVCLYQ